MLALTVQFWALDLTTPKNVKNIEKNVTCKNFTRLLEFFVHKWLVVNKSWKVFFIV